MTDLDPHAFDRLLADLGPRDRGPLIVATAGLHGNEPAGPKAVRRVIAEIESRGLALEGRFLALSGNRRALQSGKRYLDEDLNRIWEDDRIDRLYSGGAAQSREEEELREIIGLVWPALDSAPEPDRRLFLDLHSTSGPGLPFMFATDDPRPVVGERLPLPEIFGMEELLFGTSMSWAAEVGVPALAVEGGQNEDPRTVEVHEAFLWLILAETGVLSEPPQDLIDEMRGRLEAITAEAPPRVMVEYRHEIQADDAFAMEPGFANLQHVPPGTLVARDHHREYRARQEAWILFPLYQGQGNDGFFLARPF
jgi:predicted deacylase